jgi:hypothetical protein
VKVRYRVKCERCKEVMPVGSTGVRFHQRLWHSTCAADYIRARKQRQLTAV